MVEQKTIIVTWINHSYNHRNSKTLPLRENFLLEKGTDISFEILQTEKKMIENGLLPSIFFRFPGLVSDDSIFVRVTDFGLIPVGSDAWLGKGQRPKDGSIVLVHANGNEPLGINRFLTLLREEKEKILNNNWQLFDLRESIEEQETIKR
jgi:peptidoglycan/xylan/chitin deacetylase (PgdA/CDA1 family)